ncbi:MAG: hypothetical protein EBU90_11235 [Proteobacteria bacterium]|nr:hypothetical protein [Pseudomonadota bacterium]
MNYKLLFLSFLLAATNNTFSALPQHEVDITSEQYRLVMQECNTQVAADRLEGLSIVAELFGHNGDVLFTKRSPLQQKIKMDAQRLYILLNNHGPLTELITPYSGPADFDLTNQKGFCPVRNFMQSTWQTIGILSTNLKQAQQKELLTPEGLRILNLEQPVLKEVATMFEQNSAYASRFSFNFE